jgi:hypothetical protein
VAYEGRIRNARPIAEQKKVRFITAPLADGLGLQPTESHERCLGSTEAEDLHEQYDGRFNPLYDRHQPILNRGATLSSGLRGRHFR